MAQFDFLEPDDPRVQDAMDRWALDDRGRELLTAPITCATDGRLKLTLRGQAEELCDLATDPLEERPAPPDSHPEQDRVRSLRAALAAPARQTAAEVPVAEPADDIEDLEGRMKLLGYM